MLDGAWSTNVNINPYLRCYVILSWSLTTFVKQSLLLKGVEYLLYIHYHTRRVQKKSTFQKSKQITIYEGTKTCTF